MTFASTARTETTGAKTGRRFLVVDDNKDFVETLQVLLELNGHDVDVAFDGLAGLEAAIRTEPDVVVLDVGLPKLNGYEVSHRIRAATAWRRSPSSLARRAGRSLSIVSWVSTQGSTRTWSSRSSTKTCRCCWSQLQLDREQFKRGTSLDRSLDRLRRGERQKAPEGRAAVGVVFCLNRAVVGAHDRTADRKPEAESLVREK